MGWDVNIVHRNDHYITIADYWSRIGAYLCFDPLFKRFLNLTRTLCIENPPPTLFPMKPENMIYYHGPQVIAARNNDNCPDANHCQAIVSTVMVDNCHGLCHLSKSSLDLAISAGLHRQPHILSTMMNSFVMIYRSCNSVGWYTSFREDTLF